jgi:hypothetical protein
MVWRHMFNDTILPLLTSYLRHCLIVYNSNPEHGQKKHFLTTYLPLLVHVVIERPLLVQNEECVDPFFTY